MLKVADLFCGPGGISEGFRQAGFEIVYGLDKDAAAVETFGKNNPNAIVSKKDATKLDFSSIPHFDILVGGPPCVNFSSSKGSRANVLEGLRLVQAFLRLVYERKPKYWVMENVPRIAKHLPESIPLKWIGIDKKGCLDVPLRHEFNVADYGVPQLRKRYLIGKYPIPEATYGRPENLTLFDSDKKLKTWKTLGDALKNIPCPTETIAPNIKITDPNYGFSIPIKMLSDHFHPTILSQEESDRIQYVKTEHPYMGRMSFPEKMDRPSRTVVATQLGRETLVLRVKGDDKKYRRPSVRECSILQGFPISFQFYGNSLNTRYRLVGDAVPPILTFAIAQTIRGLEKNTLLGTPQINYKKFDLAPAVSFLKRKKKKTVLPINRRFNSLIPGKEMRGCRVEFNNRSSAKTVAILTSKCINTVSWSATLCVGEGKGLAKEKEFSFSEALWEFSTYCLGERGSKLEKTKAFLNSAIKEIQGVLPDATTLQAIWSGRFSGPIGPDKICDNLSKIVDFHFSKDEVGISTISKSGMFDIVPNKGLRVRIAAGLVITSLACEFINNDCSWVKKNERYIPEDWNIPVKSKCNSSNFKIDPIADLKKILKKRLDSDILLKNNVLSKDLIIPE